jgi:hypothetical protein
MFAMMLGLMDVVSRTSASRAVVFLAAGVHRIAL